MEKREVYDDNINHSLSELLDSLEKHDTIKAYKKIEKKIDEHDGLKEMVEDIKKLQKDAVKYAHYDKPNAEKEALRQADELQEAFDNHPLVLEYRECLVEANDLLHHLTSLLQNRVNDTLEKKLNEK
ncbi:RicAFT regulatory complex protein RicA family protein [Vagococcus sp. JNUCC 83]